MRWITDGLISPYSGSRIDARLFWSGKKGTGDDRPHDNPEGLATSSLEYMCRRLNVRTVIIGSFSNADNDGNENVT